MGAGSRESGAPDMAAASSARLSWQRGPIFQFFASLKLAVVLLAVLIVGAIAGTISESTFDAKVARAYIYGAPWFNLWLALLAANLTVSALSRWPWRKHHVAFLITHLGIITLLAGSLVGRVWGIEGTMTLFKGDPPSSRLLTDEHQLRVADADGIVKGYRADFLHRPPSLEKPRDLGPLAQNARLTVIGYADEIDAKLKPQPVAEGGLPALHFKIETALMGQKLESWLLADDPQNSQFAMGLANIELKRGRAANVSPAESSSPVIKPIEIEETIFAFAHAPENQISHVAKGGGSGANVSLSAPKGVEDKGVLSISVGGNTPQTIEVAENMGKEIPLTGTELSARLENYWADFRIENGKPGSASDKPNNPALVVTIHGRGVPMVPRAGHSAEKNPETGAPLLDAASAAQNHLTLFLDDAGAVSYELKSRKLGESSGSLGRNQPLVTGWADWQIVVDQTMPRAQRWMDFSPVTSGAATAAGEKPDGVRIRIAQNGQNFESWVPAGWEINVPVSPRPIRVAYGWRALPLPIAIQLREFEVKRNEGSDAPAGFKSTLQVTTAEGGGASGQCWMNNPYSFPSDWWRAWTGLTYKISQASWNPENLDQSTIQILRDPGWSLKWIGSLLVVIGVFLMFYVKQFRRASSTQAPAAQRTTIRPVATASR